MTSEKFENSVAGSLAESGIHPEDKVAVAFSGGSDSVALLTAVRALGFDCVALHCNFHLRGEESDRDEEFCRKFCREKGIRLLTADFNTMEEKLPGESVEMACRRLRYDWFAKMQGETGAEYLLTGHHRDDNIETLFLNLFRGTGIRGIVGIKAAGEHRCSPMLGLTRKDILDYLSAKGLDYVTDSTNLESEYKRNRIRNRIMPLVESDFPDAAKGISSTISNLSDVYKLFSSYIEEKKKEYIAGGRVDLDGIVRNERYPEILLYYLLEDYGFNRAQTDSVADSAASNGAEFLSAEWRGVVSGGFLELSGRKGLAEPLPFIMHIEIIGVDELKKFDRTHRTLYLDADKVGVNPEFAIRRWRAGDRIAPFGMKGKTRLVSDIFSDAGISVIKKEQVPIITLGDDILWVYGMKESNLYPVDGDTKRVMKVMLGRCAPDIVVDE